MIWGTYCPTPPHPSTLLASSEISDIQPTISYTPDFTVVNYWQKWPAQISAKGGEKSTPYTVPNQEKPHTTPYHSLIYISAYPCVGLAAIPGCWSAGAGNRDGGRPANIGRVVVAGHVIMQLRLREQLPPNWKLLLKISHRVWKGEKELEPNKEDTHLV